MSKQIILFFYTDIYEPLTLVVRLKVITIVVSVMTVYETIISECFILKTFLEGFKKGLHHLQWHKYYLISILLVNNSIFM